eukprot:3184117-Rhodomonas_salina.1
MSGEMALPPAQRLTPDTTATRASGGVGLYGYRDPGSRYRDTDACHCASALSLCPCQCHHHDRVHEFRGFRARGLSSSSGLACDHPNHCGSAQLDSNRQTERPCTAGEPQAVINDSSSSSS